MAIQISHLRQFAFTARAVVLPVFCLLILAATAAAQAPDQVPFGTGRNNQNDQPRNVKEFLARQRAEKAKKDHEELLKRGDELLMLTAQIENAYERNNSLTPADKTKLESVEKLAARIRKSLGGDGDDEPGERWMNEAKAPENEKEAVVDLKEIVTKLVDELKKTTRFTISAAAIQSSNSVLKLVRFLRLRK